MPQYYLFLILIVIIITVIIYQSFNYLKLRKEAFTQQEVINGEVSIDSSNIFIDIGKKTENDTLIKSNNTLYIKDSIRFSGNLVMDESFFKKIKSFSESYYFDSSKNQELFLMDNSGDNVCCSKEYLGILTGQTPFQLKLAQSKNIYTNQPVNKDIEYDIINVQNDGKKSSVYNKNFIMLSNDMKNIKTSYNRAIDIAYPKAQYSTGRGMFNFIRDIRTPPFYSSSQLMTGLAEKNYYCYMPNTSPNVTENP